MSYNRYGNGFQPATPAVKNLLIINVLVFVAQLIFSHGNFDGSNSIEDLFALHHYRSDYFSPYQIITHMFMHGGIFHILVNMYVLYMFGSIVERVWGPKRFLIFYFLCGIGAAAVQLLSYAYTYRGITQGSVTAEQWDFFQNLWQLRSTVGASGAIMGIVVAFGYLFPNTEMMIIPIPIPIKAKWLVIGYVVIDIFSGIASRAGDNVAHFAHVGGALTGFLIVLFWNRTNRKTFY
jgi:membrane associated rhomboid family serine protease